MARALALLDAGGSADFIVTLRPDGGPSAAAADVPGGPRAATAARAVAAAAAKAAARLSGAEPSSRPGVRVLQDLSHLPVVVARVRSRAALDALSADPRVLAVEADAQMQPALAQALPLIGQPQAAAEGFDGDGCFIGVIDMGVDFTVADLGGCPQPGAPPPCRVAAIINSTNGAAAGGPAPHGTNVASIAARTAPGARIVSFNTFTASGQSTVATILSALNQALAQHTARTYNFCSINLSQVVTTGYSAPCGKQEVAMQTAIAELRDAGVLTAAATGNDGQSGKVFAPACVDAAVSVGAAYDAAASTTAGWKLSPSGGACYDQPVYTDRPTCFSNRASYMTMLAPGSPILAGGVTQSGTSQAAPFVAGAIAVLRAANSGATPDQIVQALVSTGKQIHLPDLGLTKPRLNLYAAARAISGAPLPRDTVPPEISSVQLGGGATMVGASAPFLVDAADAGGGALELLCLTLAPAASGLTCSPWLPFAANGTFQFPSTQPAGTVTLTAFVTDDSGNTSPAATSVPVQYDPDWPFPSLSLEGGGDSSGGGGGAGPQFTRVRNINISVAGSRLFSKATTSVCLSETATTPAGCGGPGLVGWVAYVPLLPYTLASKANGPRTVRAFFFDKVAALPATHQSAALAVVLDTAAPRMAAQKSTFTAAPAAGGSVSVTFARDATDATSGVGGWLVALQAGKVKACTGLGPGAQVANVPAAAGSASVGFSGLASGTAYQVRVCAVDRAGNVATGLMRSFKAQ